MSELRGTVARALWKEAGGVPQPGATDAALAAIRDYLLSQETVERACAGMLDENEKPHTLDVWLRLTRAALTAALGEPTPKEEQ